MNLEILNTMHTTYSVRKMSSANSGVLLLAAVLFDNENIKLLSFPDSASS